jgi:hypothetical protein
VNVGSIDFDSEPAYWYEKTLRSAEAAQLPTRHRPPVNRDEALVAREVRRHLDRVILAHVALAEQPQLAQRAQARTQARTCASCGQRFSRRDWNARRLWRVIYSPTSRGGGRVELFRHLICPAAQQGH